MGSPTFLKSLHPWFLFPRSRAHRRRAAVESPTDDFLAFARRNLALPARPFIERST